MELFKDMQSAGKYPNALAHLRVIPREMRIEVVDDIEEDGDTPMASKKQDKPKGRKGKAKKDGNAEAKHDGEVKHSAEVEKIWKCFAMGKIDVSYARVGFTYNGRAVLDYSAFIDLLINYGFKIEDVLTFIDEFADIGENEDINSPIVMMNANVSRIMAEVEPLEK